MGNVISGNATGIIYQNYTAPDTVVIEGNIIGADATGEEGLPNRITGISLVRSAWSRSAAPRPARAT